MIQGPYNVKFLTVVVQLKHCISNNDFFFPENRAVTDIMCEEYSRSGQATDKKHNTEHAGQLRQHTRTQNM